MSWMEGPTELPLKMGCMGFDSCGSESNWFRMSRKSKGWFFVKDSHRGGL